MRKCEKMRKYGMMVDSVSVQTADKMLYKTTEGSEKAELHMRCSSQQRTFIPSPKNVSLKKATFRPYVRSKFHAPSAGNPERVLRQSRQTSTSTLYTEK